MPERNHEEVWLQFPISHIFPGQVTYDTCFIDHNLCVEGDINKFQALFCLHASFTNESLGLILICILSGARWK